MCGIAGLALNEGMADQPLRARAAAMGRALAHRGPDGEGSWSDEAAGVCLAHRRLAVIDLTEAGAQPMVSASGRLAMTYNGEIYNHRALRRMLEAEGATFRGHSDSEVLLEAWERWGEKRTLAALDGMFALAVWDRRERRLTLARDRFGVKPLLWRADAEGLSFASELKALLADKACPRRIDPAALTAYLRHGAVPAPWTILEGVRKLEPGSLLRWSAGREPELERWWSPLAEALEAQDSLSDAPFETLVDEAEGLIGDAVGRQMEADVPLGSFLSGGIDSALVTALMQERAGQTVDSFTIGFDDAAWDESPYAASAARHLGTRHHTLMTTGEEALGLAAEIGSVYDEPFADSSQLPTLLLCRMVRGQVTVALSGDGGDEAFAGYARYGWARRIEAYRRAPASLRRGAAAAATPLPALLPAPLGHKLQRAAALGAADDSVESYRQLLSLTPEPARLMTQSAEHQPEAWRPEATAGLRSNLARMQTIDALSYLPDDILTKVDRASMSVGLEVRVPLLDHRLWSFAMRLPEAARRTPGGAGKALLRAVLARRLPSGLFERPKAGFAVPLAQWLRSELKSWASDILASGGWRRSGLFNTLAVDRLWTQHQAGRYDHAPLLWTILMFECWRRAVLDAA